MTESIKQDIHKLKRFIIRVGSIHIGHKELSTTSSREYRKAGLALIEQGISDTLCSLDQDLIPWDILDQMEAFFHYLDRHVIENRDQIGGHTPFLRKLGARCITVHLSRTITVN